MDTKDLLWKERRREGRKDRKDGKNGKEGRGVRLTRVCCDLSKAAKQSSSFIRDEPYSCEYNIN